MLCKVTIQDQVYEYESGTSFEEIARDLQDTCEHTIVLVFEDGRLRELHHHLKRDCELSFITTADKIGFETYRRSCSMLFLSSVNRLYGDAVKKVVLHFSVSDGFYYTIGGDVELNEKEIERITEKMRTMVEYELPIRKYSVNTYEARRLFAEAGMLDKAKLFRTRIASRVNLYSLYGYEDYYYGFMVPNTRYLTAFELLPYHDGVVLRMPRRSDPEQVGEFHPSERLYRARIESEQWAEQMGLSCVGDLNECVVSCTTRQKILVSEAMQERRIAEIAAQIQQRPDVKFVMIAGPSSSGKTTFSQRLSVQLESKGMKTRCISVDNYFIERDRLPVGPDGKKDFESLSAVDTRAFNQDMSVLLDGGTIRMPTYDFVTGKRVYSGETLSLGEGELLVIEGIHCLNDALSAQLPEESKFKIYISALVQLNVDEHNRIPTTDGRLIRRIVRDYRTRGYSASQTLSMWDDVRKGEENYIYPFQNNADAYFNSSLPYELAIFKIYAMPLLLQVKESDPEYPEAKRLLKFLDYFVGIPVDDVPADSILREFVGGGCYRL